MLWQLLGVQPREGCSVAHAGFRRQAQKLLRARALFTDVLWG